MNFRNLENSIDFNDNQFTKRIIFDEDDVLSFVLNFRKGQSLPTHKHENSRLVLTVLRGEGEVKINETIQKIQRGSAVLCNGSDEFSIPKVDEDMSVFVTISPKPKNTVFSKEIG